MVNKYAQLINKTWKINKDWKLTKYHQRNLLAATFIITLIVMGLFNLFWEPMIFLLYTSWVVLNKGASLTRNEMIGLAVVKSVMFYSCIARLFGRGPALFLMIPFMIISFCIYFYIIGRMK